MRLSCTTVVILLFSGLCVQGSVGRVQNSTASHCELQSRRRMLENLISDPKAEFQRIRNLAKETCACEQAHRAITGEGEKRYAFATFIHTSTSYLCGALGLGYSFKNRLKQRPGDPPVELVALLTKDSEKAGPVLEKNGWKVRVMPNIRNPYLPPSMHSSNQNNWNKLQYWTLTEYDRVLAMDSDMLVKDDLSWLFELPPLVGQVYRGVFGSNNLLLEPSLCTFAYMLGNSSLSPAARMDPKSKNFYLKVGDQMFINKYWKTFHLPFTPIGSHNNSPVVKKPGVNPEAYRRGERSVTLQHFSGIQEKFKNRDINETWKENGDTITYLHYFGKKPWMCKSRAADCNGENFRDPALYSMYWKFFNEMPTSAQQDCIVNGAPAK